LIKSIAAPDGGRGTCNEQKCQKDEWTHFIQEL
jgi:hypothetical protein